MSSAELDQSTEQPTSLAAAFTAAEQHRSKLDSTPSRASSEFSTLLSQTISLYKTSVVLAGHLALFSPNESLDDIATSSLPYLLLHFRVAELSLERPGGIEAGRKEVLLEARSEYEKFLSVLDNYRLLGGKAEEDMWERYVADKDGFEVLGPVDAQTRREGKIRRWKEEKELKKKLEVCFFAL
jgi:immunoglobulin-binding protein 1